MEIHSTIVDSVDNFVNISLFLAFPVRNYVYNHSSLWISRKYPSACLSDKYIL